MYQLVCAFKKRLLLAAAIALPGMSALAQQTPPPATSTEPLQEIIVTGSRIAAPNEVSTSPINVITSKDIEVYGRTDISDIVNLLPQNFNNALSQDYGNGTSGLSTAAGVATADLRGLGPNRTLVLVDGRRLGIGSPYTFFTSPAPDLDQIPTGLVDRVEVVTGGASAAYGSDAIAGVVNFIMKKNFEGFQIDGNLGENWHDNSNTYIQGLVRGFNGSIPATGTVKDGRNRTFDVLMGTNFADGKGNFTGYMSYRHADAVPNINRDFGGCQLTAVQDANSNVTGTSCSGSSNSNWFEPETGPFAHKKYSVLGSSFVLRGSVPTTPPASFNSQPYIFMTREDDRYNAAFMAHMAINDYVQPYGEFFFMDDKSNLNIAPAALFKDSNPLDPLTNNYNVNCNNPLMSAQQRSILCTPAQIAAAYATPDAGCSFAQNPNGPPTLSPNCTNVRIGRRNVEGGARLQDYNHTNYRAVFGAKGDFADAWSYDAYGQYYYTTFFQSSAKFLNFASIGNALQVNGTPTAPTCVSGPPCVPYNIFSDGGVTQQQLDYLYLTGTGRGTDTLRTLHGEVTGKLGNYGITSPMAHEGVAINIGYEHRNERQFFQPDSAEQSGLLSGFGSAATPIDKSISVGEEFMELRAPLIQDKPFVKDLLFDTGFRHSDYTYADAPSTITNTYKFEVQYAPIEDVRFRASYDKAIRAPAIIELYNPQLVGLIQYGNDPCAPPVAYTKAQCLRTGVTEAEWAAGVPQGTSGQLSQLTGGNPALKPEEAQTYTFGINFAPHQIPHFSGSIDYFHIATTGLVGTLPAAVIVSNCANTGNPLYCSQIVRQTGTGGLTGATIAGGGYIVQTNVNIGAALVSGIDLQLNYRLDLPPGFGAVNFDMNGSYLQHFTSTPYVGAHTYDCAGLFGLTCQTINPRWHHIFRTTWQTAWDVSASLTWRFIGATTQDQNTGDPTLQFSSYHGYDFYNARIPVYSYFDLEATWNVNKILQLSAGANNLLDKDPPLINSTIQPGGQNTYPTYDMFGRQLFVAFKAKF